MPVSEPVAKFVETNHGTTFDGLLSAERLAMYLMHTAHNDIHQRRLDGRDKKTSNEDKYFEGFV